MMVNSYLEVFLGDIVAMWPTLPLLFFWMVAPIVCLALWPRLRWASVLVCCAAALFFLRLAIYSCWGLTTLLFMDFIGLSPIIVSVTFATISRLLEALGFCLLLAAVVVARRKVTESAD
ncbi:MAG: hypothetical protein HN348_25560 [Proteobacteria bacterium]|jgi:hypothetical protein|nr:hypothetical protein [Pseudomonadota bacterium]